MFAFANTEDYLRLEKVLDQQNDKADGFFAPLQRDNPAISEDQKQHILAYMKAENIDDVAMQRIVDSFKIVQQIKASPVANPLGTRYFSAAPFLFGQDRVMKFSAKPCAAVSPSEIPKLPQDDYLREALTQIMTTASEALYFDFMVQVRSDNVDDLGIENASTVWDETEYPFTNVAKITIPVPQLDVDSDDHRTHCEDLAFTPWHSLVEHQPIGSINRLRKSVYQASATHRLSARDFVVASLEKIFNFWFG